MSNLVVVDFQVNGTSFKLREMSFREARAHAKTGQELVARGAAVTQDEWLDRQIETVLVSLKGAGDTEWTAEKLQDDLSMRSLNAIFMRVLEISGLKIPEGEAKAA